MQIFIDQVSESNDIIPVSGPMNIKSFQWI